MSVILAGFLGGAWFDSSYAVEETAPSPEVANKMGAVLVKAYTFEAVHPNPPNHLWLNEGNGRVQIMMFDKPSATPLPYCCSRGKASKAHCVSNPNLMVARRALIIFIGPITF